MCSQLLNRRSLPFLAPLAVALAISAASRGVADEGWEKQWNEWLALARSEGEVSVLVPAGQSYRESVQGFTKAFPGIKLNVTAELIRDSLPRIQRERAAGVYSADVIVGAITPVYFSWIPNGVLADLKSVLIRPDVTDDKNWLCGYQWGWLDKAQNHTFAFTAVSPSDVHVNRDKIPESELPPRGSTFDALLDPKWIGKISWQDPRVSGQGQSIAGMILMTHGADFLKQFILKQKPVFTLDLRQQGDWIVRDRYPVALGLDDTVLGDLQVAGIGKTVQPVYFNEILAMTPQYGILGMFDHAPHQNAAKIFANWMLTRQEQEDYHRSIRSNSRRTDVPPMRQSLLPPPDACKATINHQREEYSGFKVEGGKVATEAYQQIQ
jgi:ABC-type Fe3+ transport system substrate-binding protein